MSNSSYIVIKTSINVSWNEMVTGVLQHTGVILEIYSQVLTFLTFLIGYIQGVTYYLALDK